MSEEKKEGWICPRCKKVNSPDTKQCSCQANESVETEDTRTLLNE